MSSSRRFAVREADYDPAWKADSGFSMIELLVVMIIIGILAAIAIPIFLHQKQSGYDAQAKEDLHSAATAEESYNTEFQTYTPAPTTNLPPAALASNGFRMSSNTVDITVWTYPTGVTTGGSTALSQPGGFCIKLTSGSGKPFYYSNFAGGFVSTPCP